MTTDPNLREDQGPSSIEAALQEPSPSRSEPPSIQITMPDRPKEPPVQPPAPSEDRAEPARPSSSGGIEDMLQQIAAKIDENDRRYGDALADLNGRLNTLSEAPPAPQAGDPEDSPPPATMATGDVPGNEPDKVVADAATGTDDGDAPAEDATPPEDIAPPEDVAPPVQETEAAPAADEADAGNQQLDTFEEIERRVIEFAEGRRPEPKPEPEDRSAQESVDIDTRFQDISSQLEHSLAAPLPVDEIEAELIPEAPMDETPPRDAGIDQESFAAIQSTLAELNSYFERAEAQYGRMETIEHHLNRLVEMMHGAPPGLEQAIQKAAIEAVRTYSEDGELGQALQRFESIEAELRAMSERAEHMDARTVDALTAMNHTIAALSDRLSAPQHQVHSAPEPTVPTHGTTAPRHEPASQEQRYVPPQQVPDYGHQDEFAQVRITRAGEPAGEPDFSPESHPIYPDHESVAPAGTPHGGVPQPEQAPSPHTAPAQRQQPADEDFLAAARRAAQAAAFEPELPEKSKGIFSRFRRKARQVASDLPLESKKPKPLMLFAALLLLVVSAALLYSRLSDKGAGVVTGFFERDQATPAAKAKMSAKLDTGAGPIKTEPAAAATTPKAPSHQVPDTFSPPAHRSTENRYLRSAAPHATSTVTRKAPAATSGRVPLSAEDVTGQAPTAAPDGPVTRSRLPLGLSQPTAPETAASTPARSGTPIAQPPAAIGPASLRSAAANGDPAAQYEIANRFAKGHGIKKDYDAAWRWYHHAAAQSYAPAQYMLAALYERGLGKPRDLEQARVWYRRAAELGNVKSMHNLAVVYTGRDGMPADYLQASEWFGKAAEHGLPDSQFNLGILYENGLGVSKSLTDAYKWFALAAQRGDSEAGKRRDLVKLKLTPKDLAAANQAIKTWRPKPADKAANTVVKKSEMWSRTAPAAKPAPSDRVAKAQAFLNKLGYEAGPADGKMGPKTQNAIRDFQMQTGLEATGKVTDELLTHLQALST